MTTNDEMYANYLAFRPPTWKRPEGPPRVWRVFDGRKKNEGGITPRFSIHEVPNELMNDVIDFMAEHFIPEAPISADQGVADDPIGVREFRTVWRELLRQGVSLVAFTVESDPAVRPAIAGVNILNVVTAEDKAGTEIVTKFRSKRLNRMLKAVGMLSQKIDVLRIYEVDKYLDALGLSVAPTFRGQGVGEELLRVRDDIGLTYQIPVSETIFTATSSQVLATRVGFEVLLQKKYSEIFDDEGKVVFPTVMDEYLKIMGKRLY